MTYAMTGNCTEEQFWAEVARIGWQDENPDDFCHDTEKALLLRWDDEFIKGAREWFQLFTGRLSGAIDIYEKEHEVSCECSDDGFSDLTAHIVGLGRKEYEACMKDPMRAIKRGQEYRYEENFGYCLPYEQKGKKVTYKEAKAAAEEDLKDEYGSYKGPERTAHTEMLTLQKMLGDRCRFDPRYYAAWARMELPHLEALFDSEYAGVLQDLPYVLEQMRNIADGDIAVALDEGLELQRAVERLRRQRDERLQTERERLESLLHQGPSMENLIREGLGYLTDHEA